MLLKMRRNSIKAVLSNGAGEKRRAPRCSVRDWIFWRRCTLKREQSVVQGVRHPAGNIYMYRGMPVAVAAKGPHSWSAHSCYLSATSGGALCEIPSHRSTQRKNRCVTLLFVVVLPRWALSWYRHFALPFPIKRTRKRTLCRCICPLHSLSLSPVEAVVWQHGRCVGGDGISRVAQRGLGWVKAAISSLDPHPVLPMEFQSVKGLGQKAGRLVCLGVGLCQVFRFGASSAVGTS